MAHAYDPNNWEAEAGRSAVQGRPQPHKESEVGWRDDSAGEVLAPNLMTGVQSPRPTWERERAVSLPEMASDLQVPSAAHACPSPVQ